MILIGMDAYVFRARNKKVFEEDHWYDSDQVKEVWYARKYWDMIHNVPFIRSIEGDCGEFIQLTKENIKEMIDVATRIPDYWDGFNTVPALCEILYNFDQDAEDGWHYYFEFDY